MTYLDAMAYLEGLSRFGMRLGLSRITALLDAMGNPQSNLCFIHIAGTNGKGSVSTMLANTLSHSGYKTGLFLSPYILCFRERMQVDGEMISEADFAACANSVCRCADRLAQTGESPTQFELETAIALEWYRQKGCDVVCLEVGLGGRFDSTNVIAAPLLQIITSISLDHTQVLGDTIAQIAFEKAGIIKGGTTILYPLQDPEALEVLQRVCVEKGSVSIQPDLAQLHIVCDHWLDGVFSYEGNLYHKSLPGRMQVYNCLTVIAAVHALQAQGFLISQESLQHGIETTRHPARMEVLSRHPLVLLDGAHNAAGAQALADTLAQLDANSITLVMGLLADKDESSILQDLLPYATRFLSLTPNNPRALPAKLLAMRARQFCQHVESFDDAHAAIQVALSNLGKQDALVICGSLYLASDLRPILMDALSSQAIGREGAVHG